MAFPQVADADTKSGEEPVAAASWAAEYPDNVAAGDLLLLLIGNTGAPGGADPSLPAGFSKTVNVGFACTVSIARKVAAGTESGAFSIGWPNGDRKGVWRFLRITTWEGTLAGGFAVGSAGVGTSANPDSSLLNPAAWAVEETLWFAVWGIDSEGGAQITFDAAPTDYTNLSSQDTDGSTLGSARRKLAAASEDPGPATVSRSEQWIGVTLAVRGTEYPDAPVNPAAVAVSSSRIDISWDDVATETGYRVERSPDGVGSWADISGSLPADTIAFSDTGLDPSTEYFYRVIASNAGGDSDPSAVVSATTLIGGESNRMTGGAIRKPPRR